MDRTNSDRSAQRFNGLWNIVEPGMSSGERIVNMIGARFHPQSLFEQFDRLLSVALIEEEHPLVVERIRIARHRRNARETLFADS
jgi:hypothetical protein